MARESLSAPPDADHPRHLDLPLVLVEEKPTLLALYERDESGGRIAAWVIALPDGAAVLLSARDAHASPLRTTLANIRSRWAPLLDAELVQVIGRDAVHLAA